MLCDIHLWCYNSLKAKSGYTLDRLCIRVFILVCDTSALSTASLILPLGLRQACSLFVRSLKSRFLFFLFVFGCRGAFCCLFITPPSPTLCTDIKLRLPAVAQEADASADGAQSPLHLVEYLSDTVRWWAEVTALAAMVWSSPQWDCVAFSVRSPEWVPPPTSPLFPLLHWFLITAILLTSHLSRLLFGVLIQSFSYCGAWGFVWQAGLRANTHTVTYTA